MLTVYHYQTKRGRSYFEWSDSMQIIRKGKGEIAMTESELISFFSVAWRILNYSQQLLLKACPLQPEERDAGELEVYVNGQLKGYAPLYGLVHAAIDMPERVAVFSQAFLYRHLIVGAQNSHVERCRVARQAAVSHLRLIKFKQL